MRFIRLIPTIILSAIAGFIVLMISSFLFGRMFEGLKPLDWLVGLGVPLVLTTLTMRNVALSGIRRLRCLEIEREFRRRVAGRCSRCGYSLTGNTSGVCPECGRAIS